MSDAAVGLDAMIEDNEDRPMTKAEKAKYKTEWNSKALVQIDMNVLDAALGRLRWLFDEFDGRVSVSISGGKDSTVIMELAAIVARERGQKLKVQFLDQEAEWQGTVDYLRYIKNERDDIDFDWYQMPFRLFNAASHESEWGYMWPTEEPETGYMRPPEPNSIRVNDFGEDRFQEVLHAMNKRQGGVHLTGMRAEESPTRRLGMTTRPAYKWATWGAGDPNGDPSKEGTFWLMHPIYDWSFRDIWQAMHQFGWRYNTIYDELYRHGVPHRDMRVSSLIHSGAVRHIEQIQEIEPYTWERLTIRFAGVNAAAHVGEDSIQEFRGKKPMMFDTWVDYWLHLVNNLVAEEHRPKFIGMMETAKSMLPWMSRDRIAQKMIPMVMKNDYFSDYSFQKWVTSSTQWAENYQRENGALPDDWAKPVEK